MDVLRQTIARIEGGGSTVSGFDRVGASDGGGLGSSGLGSSGRGSSGRSSSGKVALGRGLALDGALGGGLARGGLSEVVAGAAGDAGAASGFALALAARFAAEATGPIVWILEDAAAAEHGAPYPPGLAAHGIDPARLIVVRVASGADGLWAMEEALRCRAIAAAVLDLWRTKTYDLVASRRLVLAAAGGAPGLVIPAGAPGTARALSTASQVRFEVAAAPGAGLPAGPRLPLPGRAAWRVRLARIRAGPAGLPAGFDGEKHWPLHWDHDEARFCDAVSIPTPAVSRHRPHSPARDGGWRVAG